MKKYIITEVTLPDLDYEYGDSMGWEELELHPKSISLDEMLKQPEFRAELVRRGWIDREIIDKLKDEAGDNLGPRMFVLSRYLHHYHKNVVNGQIVDEATVGTLSFSDLGGVEHIFAVEVGYQAMAKISPHNAKLIERIEANAKAKKKVEAVEKKKKEDAKKKRALRQIEDAKKLLAKAGILKET